MLKQFIKISQTLGKHAEYVQGRGGNTSYKSGDEMYIKASGFLLKDVKKNNGYTVCKIQPMIKFLLSKKDQSDTILDTLITTTIQKEKSFGKPSMETAMHAIIPSRYVIHTHSMYANVFNCIKNPQKYLKEILPTDYAIIPYKNPGYFLANHLANLQNKKKFPQVLFLKNHGLLIHGNSADKVLEKHTEVNDKLKEFLAKHIDTNLVITKEIADFSQHLFPDSVVYSSVNKTDISENKKQEIYEISSAIHFIKKGITALQEPIVYIAQENVEYIRNMGQEKHRIAMIG